jgi:BirA family transcriptional regulator, biotin operon repressor / biotin---[acetyl-CoA-carboxylase] ligase
MTLVLPHALALAGDELVWLDQVDSTMDEARRRFSPGLAHRIWIVAGRQSAGRGRQGRNWTSQSGNLHMTLLSPTATPLREQPKLGFAAGVALCRAARATLGSAATVAVKWPNDLLIGGAKASGLLLEGHGQGEAIAIGIGVNVTSHPPDTPYPATHLGAHAVCASKDPLFVHLSGCLVEEIDTFALGRGFQLTRARWLANAAHLGRQITVRQDDKTVEGLFEDIDDDGQLRLSTSQGLRRIAAGDVFPLDK